MLVCPRQPHRRFTDLSVPELTDLVHTVQRVQRLLAAHYFAPSPEQEQERRPTAEAPTEATPPDGSFNLALQDGPGAGQTVPHVHVYVIPRVLGASAQEAGGDADDLLYERMAAEAGNVGGALWDRDHGLPSPPARSPPLPSSSGEAGEALGRPRPGGRFPLIEDCDRVPRSLAEMEAEAALFRAVLERIERREETG